MSTRKTDSSKLADLVAYELNRWSTEKAEKIKQYGKNIANEGMRQLRAVDMSGLSGGRSWAKNYSKNWRVSDRSGTNYCDYYIHNGNKNNPTYRLTHLLEYGHATRNGGRTRAFPHIKNVESWCKTEFVKGVEEILKDE